MKMKFSEKGYELVEKLMDECQDASEQLSMEEFVEFKGYILALMLELASQLIANGCCSYDECECHEHNYKLFCEKLLERIIDFKNNHPKAVAH